MSHYENVWSFETANLRVSFDVAPEDYLDLSWDDDGSIREGLESGKYVAFVARVRVTHKATGAELGADYLGCCIYESPREFMDHRGLAAKSRADRRNYGSYFSDMVRTACQEARKQLAALRNIPVRIAA
jgi:hypothetical protein